MSQPSEAEVRPLDEQTRLAMVQAVDDAKASGWTQTDFSAWFAERGVTLADYIAAKNGKAVSTEVRGVLAVVSIVGFTRDNAEDVDPFPDIPDAMKIARRWLVWRSEPNTDPTKKPRKVPYYASGKARYGTLDGPEDTAQLVAYPAACAALAFGGFTGLGFALGPDGTGNHWQGIDLDNLADHPGLRFLVEEGLPGYTEKSPSGGGIHAIGYGRDFISLGSNSTGIEAYAHGRYFTVTGDSAGRGEIECLADFVDGRLQPLHSQRPQDTSAPAQEGGGSLAGAMAAPDLRSALAYMRADDRDLWIRMGHALHGLGEQGRGLWLEWSQTSPKYDPADAARVWDSLRPERTGFQAVFAEAQRQGWVNPARGRPAEQAALPAHDPVTGEVTEDTFEVLSIADLRAMPDAQWLIKDAIPAEGLMFIYGPPASFKSFVCYDLALSFAYGFDNWIGQERRASGGVLYIASEGISGAKNRIQAWQLENGIAEDTDRFHIIRKTINFLSADDRGRLVRTVAAHVAANGPVSMIFVDTVSRVLPGADENLQKDMTIFVSACDALRAFGATVCGVHHTNKEGAMRGSTVFLGQGDAVYKVERNEGSQTGVLSCEKLKDAPDGWKRAFEVREKTWTPEGKIEGVSSLVAVFGADIEPPKDPDLWPSRSVCRDILKDIDKAWQKGKPWSPYPQTSKEGRYAPANISAAHSVPAAVAKMMLEAWLRNDVLSLETADTHSKSKGLRVLQWLD